jgi:hypothetical protein
MKTGKLIKRAALCMLLAGCTVGDRTLSNLNDEDSTAQKEDTSGYSTKLLYNAAMVDSNYIFVPDTGISLDYYVVPQPDSVGYNFRENKDGYIPFYEKIDYGSSN